MWNWKKITQKIEDLPKFGKPVMLFWKKDNKKYATVGYLKSIDSDGYNWSYAQETKVIDFINSIFTGAIENNITPTHWCEIETPEE
jgi:hypothetical protein